MLKRMKSIIAGNNVCVMATVSGETPHCSLMSYAPGEECRELYMMTSRSTKKFDNLQKNNTVSLLIDTRKDAEGNDLSSINALTVTGTFQQITDPTRREQVTEILIKVHPHLKDLAKQPETEVFAVRIRSCQLLQGIADAHYANMD